MAVRGWLISCAIEPELAEYGHAHQVPNLLSLKCSLSLSFPTAAALKQNVTEKDGLEWNDRRDGYDKPTILLPDRWLTKEHDTARWQSRFTDAPSLQLPAVIGWRAE